MISHELAEETGSNPHRRAARILLKGYQQRFRQLDVNAAVRGSVTELDRASPGVTLWRLESPALDDGTIIPSPPPLPTPSWRFPTVTCST